jgi:hypothetical protein
MYAESCTLNVELHQQISSFYHTTIHQIIGIKMYHTYIGVLKC